MVDQPRDSARRWDVGSALALAAVLAAHLAHLVRDTRVPADPGQFYGKVSLAWEALGRLDPRPIVEVLGVHGGAWELVLGALMRLTGPSPAVMDGASLVWTGLALGATWALARRLAGPRAALAAIALAGCMPLVVHWGRIGWIHLPEAALLTGAAAVLAGDARLSRRGTAWGVALLGAAALSLRPSAMVFAAPLAVVVLAGGWRSARWRVGGIGAAWLVGSLPDLAALASYLRIKLDARPRYAVSLPTAWEEAPDALGPALVLGTAGLVLLGVVRRGRLRPLEWVLVAWLALSVGLDLAFRVGLFNFTLLGVALAVLGGAGLAAVRPRWPAVVPAAVLVLLLALPEVPGSEALARVPTLHAHTRPADPWHQHRPWTGYGADEVLALVAALCPDQACTLAVDQGIFTPFAEDPGAFSLFLLRQRQLRPTSVAAWERHGPRADALVAFDCPEEERARLWRVRNPGTAQGLRSLVEQQRLVPVWGRVLVEDCTVWWWAPEGRVRYGGLLPETGTRPGPEAAEALRRAVLERSPAGELRGDAPGPRGQPGARPPR